LDGENHISLGHLWLISPPHVISISVNIFDNHAKRVLS
jgi:hypothetical protein